MRLTILAARVTMALRAAARCGAIGMKFSKMHGLGNDYIYVNGFAERLDGVDLPALSRRVSDRHRGVGSDGLIVIRPDERADVRMEMYNADGSRGRMCGNGIRCVARYALERGLARRNPLRIATDSGLRPAQETQRDGALSLVTVVMGRPRYEPEALPARFVGERIHDLPLRVNGRELRIRCVSVGNPHAVILVRDLGEIDLARDGAALERHEMFPEQVNVHFVRKDGPSEVTMQTWERGSGATQACGTGACAVAMVVEEPFPVRVHLPGGDLEIDYRPPGRNAAGAHAELLELAADEFPESGPVILMTGPAEHIFDGDWPLP